MFWNKLYISASYLKPFVSYLFHSVPVRDDGNMPDVPGHPSEPKGNNLEWLKNL